MSENTSMQALLQELQLLKQQIRDNERIWAGFREIEVRLIGADSPAEILGVLTRDLPRIFPRISGVSLAWLDSERELPRLLGDICQEHFVEVSAEELQGLFPSPCRPRLGPCSEIAGRLYPDLGNCGSAAMVPLLLRGRLVGSLNEMSHAPDHFFPSDATDLLEHLAAVLVMCLENALGRERLKMDGLTDPLTGIANRRLFDRRLTEETEHCTRRGEPLGCLLADIDHFKAINDHFGHGVGDEILRSVATAMAAQLRTTDILARYGGEEFVLLLPNTDGEQASAIAERLRAAIESIESSRLDDRRLSISIGCAVLHPGEARPGAGEALLQQADTALYQAKAAGRNCVRAARREDRSASTLSE